MAGPLNFSEYGPEPEARQAPPVLLQEDATFKVYLDTVCGRLAALAPPEWLEDLRAELTCHLECTAAAYEELGETPEQAAASACRSLGDPVKLEQRWERFWQEKRPEPFRKTFQLAFVRFGAAALAAPELLLLPWWNPFRNLSPAVTHFADLLTLFTVFFLPMGVGVAFARRSRGRAFLGATAALLAVAALSALLGPLVPGEDTSGLKTSMWQCYLIYWLPLGSAAAGITGLARTRRERHRLQRGS